MHIGQYEVFVFWGSCSELGFLSVIGHQLLGVYCVSSVSYLGPCVSFLKTFLVPSEGQKEVSWSFSSKCVLGMIETSRSQADPI